MEHLPNLLESIASLSWPFLVLIGILKFSPGVRSLLDSAQRRAFTVKIGGQELTMAEVSEQQQTLIADLQAQVLALQQGISDASNDQSESPGERTLLPSRRRTATAVLWVDDQPKNNSYFIQQLLDARIEVDLALTTAEGMHRFEKNAYAAVISDMGRLERGEYVNQAGLELLAKIREADQDVPFIIFCSGRGVRAHRERALAGGATAITSSATQLLGSLRSIMPEGSA